MGVGFFSSAENNMELDWMHINVYNKIYYMVGCILFAFRIQNRPATTNQLRTTGEKKTWHSVPFITELTQPCTVRCYYTSGQPTLTAALQGGCFSMPSHALLSM